LPLSLQGGIQKLEGVDPVATQILDDLGQRLFQIDGHLTGQSADIGVKYRNSAAGTRAGPRILVP
jgi:hypothetical protein